MSCPAATPRLAPSIGTTVREDQKASGKPESNAVSSLMIILQVVWSVSLHFSPSTRSELPEEYLFSVSPASPVCSCYPSLIALAFYRACATRQRDFSPYLLLFTVAIGKKKGYSGFAFFFLLFCALSSSSSFLTCHIPVTSTKLSIGDLSLP
jgi:hypothetical protein